MDIPLFDFPIVWLHGAASFYVQASSGCYLGYRIDGKIKQKIKAVSYSNLPWDWQKVLVCFLC